MPRIAVEPDCGNLLCLSRHGAPAFPLSIARISGTAPCPCYCAMLLPTWPAAADAAVVQWALSRGFSSPSARRRRERDPRQRVSGRVVPLCSDLPAAPRSSLHPAHPASLPHRVLCSPGPQFSCSGGEVQQTGVCQCKRDARNFNLPT